jgi:putative transposase
LRDRKGPLWQNRFYCCPVDGNHLRLGVRYVEVKPVRTGLVEQAWDWPWSSAGVDIGTRPWPLLLDRELWPAEWDSETWEYLLQQETDREAERRLRQSTYQGCALGGKDFVPRLEEQAGRRGWGAERGLPPF